ncbi:MAG: transglycosylase domain-containing protein, partial [Alphaproteobacteria bacterium]
MTRERSRRRRPAGQRPRGHGKPARRRTTQARARGHFPMARVLKWAFTLAIWLVLMGGAAVAWLAWDLPDVDRLSAETRQPGVVLLTASGDRLASYGDLYGARVALDQLPPYLPRAVLATEDRRFYEHSGLDPRGIARAMLANLRKGRIVQGGSTITQQLAKNLFLTRERSLERKAKEALLALWLEANFDKDELLTIYLNRVYLGGGAYGVEAAAQKYFGHSSREVSLYEAAMLAGLLSAPSRNNPLHDPETAHVRALAVLDAMVAAGYLSPENA